MRLIALLALLAAGGAAHAEMLQCYPTDGDSLRCGDLAIRIAGIDAPETRLAQTCQYRLGRGSADWEMARGRMALEALQGLLDATGGWVRVEVLPVEDRYGRAIADVFAGDMSVGEWMIEQGHAVAYHGELRDHWCEP